MSNNKKKEQLGVAYGTAANKLKKHILWHYICKSGDNVCYQCGKTIESVDELSVEHKTPWLDSSDPKKLFYSLDNIAFSHLSCNCSAARKRKAECGSYASFRNGCNCSDCYEAYKAAHVIWNKKRYTPEKRREQYLRTGK